MNKITNFEDFLNYQSLNQLRDTHGVFCTVCGLEIDHGIKGNPYCSKKCHQQDIKALDQNHDTFNHERASQFNSEVRR